MNKTVVKVLGLGALTIGGVVFAMFVKDEKEALSKKGIESWADEKAKSARSEETEKLFKNFEAAKKDYEEDQKKIDANIDVIMDRWKVDQGINKKLRNAEKARDKAIEDYKISVDYNEQLKKALEKRDSLIKEWESESGYNNEIALLDSNTKDAKNDYERGKQALKLIANDDIRKASEKMLKEEYDKRCESIRKDREDLFDRHKKAISKAQEWYNSVVDPITEKFRKKKKEYDDIYESETKPLYESIKERRKAVSEHVYGNKPEVSTRIEKRYQALEKDVNDVSKVEADIKEQYIRDAEKYNANILYDNLEKKGWSKFSIFFFEGALPIGIGMGFMYISYKFIRFGVNNIRALYAVSSVK